jgi:hypothetical protein
MMKMITKQHWYEVGPRPSGKLYISIDGAEYSCEDVERQKHDKPELQGVECSTNPRGYDSFTIDGKEVLVRFDGKQTRIQLPAKNRRTSCGLCGNYDDDRRNDHRKPNREMATQLLKGCSIIFFPGPYCFLGCTATCAIVAPAAFFGCMAACTTTPAPNQTVTTGQQLRLIPTAQCTI